MKLKKLLGILVISTYIIIYPYTVDAAMSYEQALIYQQNYSEDIHAVTKKQKDIYGEKNKRRYFSFLGNEGLLHSGKSNVGKAGRTLFNYIIDYGFENIEMEPYVYIRWMADLAGNPEKGYEPKTLQIVFEDNYIKTFSLQGWEYHKMFVPGLLLSSWGHNYHGRIKLTHFDIYEMSKHGKVLSASMDAGNDTIKHFFYSGGKDADKKEMLTRAIKHSMRILQIDENKITEEIEAHERAAEQERLNKLRAEVEKEIKEEAEREAMKKAILEEMKKNKDI